MADPETPRPDENLRMFLAEHEAACPGCGYSLRGCVAEVCPECGTRLVLTLAAARADRRTLFLLLLMLGWALLASGTETYLAQRKARGEAQTGGWQQFGTITTGPGTTVRWSGNVQGNVRITLPSRATAGGGASRSLVARQITVTQPPAGAFTWSAVLWQTWVRLGAWSVLLLLAAIGLIGVACFRGGPAWPRRFVSYAAGVFAACAVLSVFFRLPIV